MKKLFVVCMLASVSVALGCGDDDPSENAATNNQTTNNQTTNNGTTNNGTTNNATTNNALTPSVTVDDQVADPANQVVIAEVVSDGAGFIVIHEADGDTFGAVIGFAPVTDGANGPVTVSLDRDAENGETLYAMLHTDDPADGDYTFGDDPTTDGPVTVDGEVVAPTFTVTVASDENSLTVMDQTLDFSTRVTVASANSLGAGWMVIHEDDGGAPGAVIGVAPVTDGANAAIDVILDRPATDGETLYAMLHEDSPADGAYTFDGANGEDMPALDASDEVVVAGFETTVAADTPAVRFTLNNSGQTAFEFTAAEPAFFEAWISDVGGNNPTLTLAEGWRYEIDNQASTAHPLELVGLGATRPADTVLLAQGGDTGSLEDDTDVNWTETAGTVGFTLTPTLNAELSGYRCGVTAHVLMRGEIVNP